MEHEITCPNCGGSGTESSEVMARYGDDPYVCPRCNGKKTIMSAEVVYTHTDRSGMRWRFVGSRPVSELADIVMETRGEKLEYYCIGGKPGECTGCDLCGMWRADDDQGP